MWNARIEELRSELNRKVESGVSLSKDVLEMSRKLDKAINEYYRCNNDDSDEEGMIS